MMRDNAQVAFVVLILINAYTYHPSLIFIHPFLREFSGESCVGSGVTASSSSLLVIIRSCLFDL
ncbi:hypothetical protein DER44DRAFT_385427 [Fusarium oxysporum]|nr:hypothetical protein DER44DRAFT_385427 [Fusarium oxysporum]